MEGASCSLKIVFYPKKKKKKEKEKELCDSDRPGNAVNNWCSFLPPL